MTLIEIMIAYRDRVEMHGREAGLRFLDKVLNDLSHLNFNLKLQIITSVSDDGYFIDPLGNRI